MGVFGESRPTQCLQQRQGGELGGVIAALQRQRISPKRHGMSSCRRKAWGPPPKVRPHAMNCWAELCCANISLPPALRCRAGSQAALPRHAAHAGGGAGGTGAAGAVGPSPAAGRSEHSRDHKVPEAAITVGVQQSDQCERTGPTTVHLLGGGNHTRARRRMNTSIMTKLHLLFSPGTIAFPSCWTPAAASTGAGSGAQGC